MKLKNSYLIIGLSIFPLPIFGALVWEKQEIEVKPTALIEKVTADFYFTNQGTNPVTISRVKTSCGCTTAKLDKKIYQAGESGSIKAEFEVGSRTGFQQKHILVTTDFLTNNPAQLTLKVYLPELLKVEPNLLQWKRDETNELKKIAIESTGIVPIKLIGVELPHEWFDTELKVKESGKFYEVLVRPLKSNEPVQASLKIQALVGTNSVAKWFFAKVGVK